MIGFQSVHREDLGRTKERLRSRGRCQFGTGVNKIDCILIDGDQPSVKIGGCLRKFHYCAEPLTEFAPGGEAHSRLTYLVIVPAEPWLSMTSLGRVISAEEDLVNDVLGDHQGQEG